MVAGGLLSKLKGGLCTGGRKWDAERMKVKKKGDLRFKKPQSPVIKANGSIVSKKHLIALEYSGECG